MAKCLIGCGSNIGPRREQLDRAIEFLRYMPGVALQKVSHWKETVPIGGPPGQESFLNGACLIETDLSPQDVLSVLHAVENTLQRNRSERWGPRTVDLDLLLYEDLILHSASLTVPHPRMSTRRFVLEPCVEIAGDIRHPTSACTLKELLANIQTVKPHIAVVGVECDSVIEVTRAVGNASLGLVVHQSSEWLPVDASLSEWSKTLSCMLQAMDGAQKNGEHGFVTDFWLETLALAARETLPIPQRDEFLKDFASHTVSSQPPHVLFLLVVPATRLSSSPEKARLQRQMIEVANDPTYHSHLKPKAVVMIDAENQPQARADAVAAVEAMV
ncbi:MAG: 2-amino-4-hydroxy-6-hydroxymethyldihydropteridine diphosphokinase [Pirellulales bacterium]